MRTSTFLGQRSMLKPGSICKNRYGNGMNVALPLTVKIGPKLRIKPVSRQIQAETISRLYFPGLPIISKEDATSNGANQPKATKNPLKRSADSPMEVAIESR